MTLRGPRRRRSPGAPSSASLLAPWRDPPSRASGHTRPSRRRRVPPARWPVGHSASVAAVAGSSAVVMSAAKRGNAPRRAIQRTASVASAVERSAGRGVARRTRCARTEPAWPVAAVALARRAVEPPAAARQRVGRPSVHRTSSAARTTVATGAGRAAAAVAARRVRSARMGPAWLAPAARPGAAPLAGTRAVDRPPPARRTARRRASRGVLRDARRDLTADRDPVRHGSTPGGRAPSRSG